MIYDDSETKGEDLATAALQNRTTARAMTNLMQKVAKHMVDELGVPEETAKQWFEDSFQEAIQQAYTEAPEEASRAKLSQRFNLP